MATVYQINKGINKPIEFKGIKGRYIAYLAIGLVCLLIAFATLYISGVSLFIVLPVILGSGAGLFFSVSTLSHKYGQYGLMKYFARKRLPGYLKFKSRRLFTQLKKQ